MKVKIFAASTEPLEPVINQWLQDMGTGICIHHVTQSQSSENAGVTYLTISIFYSDPV